MRNRIGRKGCFVPNLDFGGARLSRDLTFSNEIELGLDGDLGELGRAVSPYRVPKKYLANGDCYGPI